MLRSLFSSSLLFAACVLAVSGCSLVYDAGRFQGGTGGDGGDDAGTDGGGGGDDAGPDHDAGDVDAGDGCANDGDCADDEFCLDNLCELCDFDEDGFVADDVPADSCGVMLRRGDCDDENPNAYPGAPPICNNDIDESCFDPTTFPVDGVTEVGFVQPIDITNEPADARLRDVQIFGHGGPNVVVFTHMDETRNTPRAVEVDLAARTQDPMMGLSEWAGGGTIMAAAGTAIYTEAVRIGNTVHLGEIHTESIRTMRMQNFAFSSDGTGPTMTGVGSVDLNGAGLMGLTLPHQPMFLRPDGGGVGMTEFFWGAGGSTGGSTRAVYAIGSTSGSIASIDDGGWDPAVPTWASSSELFGLVTQEGNPSFWVWMGNTMDPGATGGRHTVWGTGSTLGGAYSPGVITTVDPGRAHGGPYALVAIPRRGLIDVQLLSCTFVAPFACSPIANGTIPTPTSEGTRALAVTMVSETSAMFLIADSDTMDGIHFGTMELYDDMTRTWSIPPTVVTTRIPSDGMGRLTDLALDQSFEVDLGVAGAGSATVAYAYLRQPMVTSLPSHISVAALRACVGYDGP